ncbi:hypothetical protein VNO77_44120 [Canavalia gladiata]|uniref:Pectate lyase n=1 Tax=Canavalia gladiata TaxID=3824 RepID=A0AAN9JXM3_CANGL
MTFSFTFLFQFLLLAPTSIYASPFQDPESVVQEVQKSINVSRRNLGFLSCGTGNPIDDCWRCDPNWERNRKRLANCGIGFGRHAIGGKDGKVYMVTDPGDDPMNPKVGTLRHAVIQHEPLWIIFKHDMMIKLEMDLLVNSYKTIDGRGANVHLAEGPCIKIHHKTNIIIHGIHIHDCKRGGSGSDEGLGGRMPRCRFGYFHVVNNDYTHWQHYAIGGSSSPTIFSQGNRFLAPDDEEHKEVTKHFRSSESEWRKWNWRSEGDVMLNGAFFTPSGAGAGARAAYRYNKASSMAARPPMLVPSITAEAGALGCKKGYPCY